MNKEEAIKQSIENLIQENKELKEGNKTMLSDEERKAIDELWHFDCAYNREIKIVLNLIEKQSKEIEHQKEKRENQKQELAILNAKQIEFNKLVNTVNSYKGQFKRQQKEIEEFKKPKYIMNFKTNEITILKNDFVSKDKIKAKIEDLKENSNGDDFNLTNVIMILQSLLEKE